MLAPTAIKSGVDDPKQMDVSVVSGAEGNGSIVSVALSAGPSQPATVCVTKYS